MARKDHVLEEDGNSDHSPDKKTLSLHRNKKMILRFMSTVHSYLTYQSLKIVRQFPRYTFLNTCNNVVIGSHHVLHSGFIFTYLKHAILTLLASYLYLGLGLESVTLVPKPET